jgi:hypothetical protein
MKTIEDCNEEKLFSFDRIGKEKDLEMKVEIERVTNVLLR